MPISSPGSSAGHTPYPKLFQEPKPDTRNPNKAYDEKSDDLDEILNQLSTKLQGLMKNPEQAEQLPLPDRFTNKDAKADLIQSVGTTKAIKIAPQFPLGVKALLHMSPAEDTFTKGEDAKTARNSRIDELAEADLIRSTDTKAFKLPTDLNEDTVAPPSSPQNERDEQSTQAAPTSFKSQPFAVQVESMAVDGPEEQLKPPVQPTEVPEATMEDVPPSSANNKKRQRSDSDSALQAPKLHRTQRDLANFKRRRPQPQDEKQNGTTE